MVYVVKDVNTNETYALKLYRVETVDPESRIAHRGYIEKEMNKGKVASEGWPYFLQYLEAFEFGKFYCIKTEYLTSLQSIVKGGKKFTEEVKYTNLVLFNFCFIQEIVWFLYHCLRALLILEQHHLLHRNIKKENIFLGADGIYKLGFILHLFILYYFIYLF
jgi:serine/threonine protein kinase